MYEIIITNHLQDAYTYRNKVSVLCGPHGSALGSRQGILGYIFILKFVFL